MSNIKVLLESDGRTLKQKTANEYSTACPWCGGKDRFLVWIDSNTYWCRQCERKGDAIQFLRDKQGLSYQDAARLTGHDDGKWTRQRQRQELRKNANIEEVEKHRLTAIKANKIYRTLSDATSNNSYLKRKKVPTYPGFKVIGKKDKLVIPVYGPGGDIISLQFIPPEAGQDKVFLKGSKTAGGYFPIQGNTGEIYLAEGIATALSIHEATGCMVICAFTSNNLEDVAKMIKEKYPDSKIIICGDDDRETEERTGINPGKKAAEAAARATGAEVAFPVSKTGQGTDFNDLHVSEGLEAVRSCLEGATVAPVASVAGGVRVLSIHDFLMMEIAKRTYLLNPIIPSQGLIMMYALRGIGKTNLALHIAYAVATGQAVCRWQAPEAQPVLYIDGEMPAITMQERLAGIVKAYPIEPEPGYFKIITPDLQDRSINLATPEGQQTIDTALDGVKLVIVDNLATLCRSGRENETESWHPVQDWLLNLRRRGISVLLIHHSNKSGGQRGTSSREDILDTVIVLKRPSDYTMDQGARFEIHLEKARGIIGDDAKPFEAMLTPDGQGGMIWACRDIEDAELDQVISLTKEGLSIRDISKETGLSKSKIQRLIKKAGHDGK